MSDLLPINQAKWEKISGYANSRGKNTKVRQVHCSQIGFICSHETPEGPQSGIVKNLNPLVKTTLCVCT